MIAPGLTHTSTLTVTAAQTAEAMGSGDLPVLATPAMISLMENAAMLAVAAELPEGSTTVGGFMECSHLVPTPIGAEVEAVAILRQADARSLHFDIAAYCGEKKLGEGHHVRYIVDRTRFLSKL